MNHYLKSYFSMKSLEPVQQKVRARKSSQDSGSTANRGRASLSNRNIAAGKKNSCEMSKSSSISNINQVRPRSTSLTRSQSQRLGGRGGSVSGSRANLDRAQNVVRPRSSTITSTQQTAKGKCNFQVCVILRQSFNI